MCLNDSAGFACVPLSPYIYGASVLMGEIGRDSRVYDESLIGMYGTLAQRSFGVLTSVEAMEAQPDLVEELFEYSAKCIRIIPSLFFAAPILNDTVQRGGNIIP